MSENMKSRINVSNYTSEPMMVSDAHLDWGKWVTNPVDCPQKHRTDPAAYSEGAEGSATGTTGWIEWKIGASGSTVRVSWSVPYIGDNSYGASVAPPSSPYQATVTGPSKGNDNTFTLALNDAIGG